MSTIPKEYLDSSFDFGFTATDDITQVIEHPQQPVVSTEDITGPVIDRIHSLESSVNEILTILDRMEQAGTPNFDTDEYKVLIEKDVKDKLHQVEALIIPLLVNLMKNPEKDYINWANRQPMIQKQIDKIIAITRA